jgi:hypothetical protein
MLGLGPVDRIETLAYERRPAPRRSTSFSPAKGITPLIQMPGLWDSEPERTLPGHDGPSNVV